MNYCNQCGASVIRSIPEGDHLPRFVCSECHSIHYENPRIIAGCIPELDNKILLCRRAIEPKYGLWTLPAGFMENNETTLLAATRETMEEANITLESPSLFSIFSIPHISQVYMFYRGTINSAITGPGTESLEIALFSEAEIPWNDLAFPVVSETLKLYFEHQHNHDATFNGAIIKTNDQLITRFY
ncbi:MAG: NUDIX hydrolase [Gammaproteobacteria bacterium]|nr:NUDIX hydrolase [Gammaproteobacteria bacterium]